MVPHSVNSPVAIFVIDLIRLARAVEVPVAMHAVACTQHARQRPRHHRAREDLRELRNSCKDVVSRILRVHRLAFGVDGCVRCRWEIRHREHQAAGVHELGQLCL